LAVDYFALSQRAPLTDGQKDMEKQILLARPCVCICSRIRWSV